MGQVTEYTCGTWEEGCPCHEKFEVQCEIYDYKAGDMVRYVAGMKGLVRWSLRSWPTQSMWCDNGVNIW